MSDLVEKVAQAIASKVDIRFGDEPWEVSCAKVAIAAVEADGWKTMDSAPRDGTPILCFTPDYLSDGFSDASGIDVLWFDEGSWLYNANPVAFQPTHWRHLPAAPEVE